MPPDNPSDQEETPNPVAHIHHYVLKGSGLSCWAECDVIERAFIATTAFMDNPCRAKLTGDNGPIVGSRAKVLAAMP